MYKYTVDIDQYLVEMHMQVIGGCAKYFKAYENKMAAPFRKTELIADVESSKEFMLGDKAYVVWIVRDSQGPNWICLGVDSKALAIFESYLEAKQFAENLSDIQMGTTLIL